VDIFDFTTASRFSDYYFQKRGCYRGVFELQSNNQAFVQEAVQGGICAVNEDYRKEEITLGVASFDMNSMYPSAMMRIGEECGYPTGLAVMTPTENLSYPLSYRHYVVHIRIRAINKYQQIPLVSVKVKGIIKRLNRGDIPDCTFVVDKITLEDKITPDLSQSILYME